MVSANIVTKQKPALVSMHHSTDRSILRHTPTSKDFQRTVFMKSMSNHSDNDYHVYAPAAEDFETGRIDKDKRYVEVSTIPIIMKPLLVNLGVVDKKWADH